MINYDLIINSHNVAWLYCSKIINILHWLSVYADIRNEKYGLTKPRLLKEYKHTLRRNGGENTEYKHTGGLRLNLESP